MNHPRIAITGGIGAGKSYVCRMLEARGIEIFDCDAVAKNIIAHDTDVHRELTALIGTPLTKDALRRYIHADVAHAARVNAIVHPRVAQAFDRSRQQWMECAILFESGFDRLVDRVVVVTCPEAERLRRITARDNCTADTARRWIALQTSDDERLRRAALINGASARLNGASARLNGASARLNGDGDAFHIINDGTTPLEPQISRLLKLL